MNKIKEFWKNNREENWFIITLIVLFFPVGIYLMWRYSGWNKAPKWAVTALFTIFVFTQTPAEETEADEDVVQSKNIAVEESTEKKNTTPRSEASDEDKAEMKSKQEERDKKEAVATEKEKAEQERIDKDKAEKEEEAEKLAAAAEKEKAEQERIDKDKAEKEEAEKLATAAEKEAEEKLKKQKESDQSVAEEIYLQIMKDSVGSYVDIELDKESKIFTLTPTDQGLIDEISLLPMGIGHDNWATLVDGMASMSKGGKELVGEGYTMNLVNPVNEENIILWIIDGVIIYDVIDEL